MVTSTAKLRIQPHDILFVRSSLNQSFCLGDETDFNCCAGNEFGLVSSQLSSFCILLSGLEIPPPSQKPGHILLFPL